MQIRQLLVILKAITKASMEAEQPEHGTARSPAAVFAAQVAALVSLIALSKVEGPAIPLGTARTALNQQLRCIQSPADLTASAQPIERQIGSIPIQQCALSAAALSGRNLRIKRFPRFDEAHRVQRIVTYVRKFAHAVQDDLCNMHVHGRATGPELAEPSTSGGRNERRDLPRRICSGDKGRQSSQSCRRKGRQCRPRSLRRRGCRTGHR